LVEFANRLLNQYGNVFTPASSRFQAAGATEDLQRLAVNATRYGLYISLPIVAVLAIAGGPIVRLWMGSNYEAPMVLAVLAVGHLPALASRGAYRILVGLNQHGRAGLAELVWALVSIGLGLLFVGAFGGGILGAAAAVAIAVTIGAGVLPQVYICRALKCPLLVYLKTVVPGPVAAVLPLIACLTLARAFFGTNTYVELLVGLGGGSAVSLATYWRYVLPEYIRSRVLQKLRLRAGGPERQCESTTVRSVQTRT
jgi:O-antigen/teichoic acid export membrane protein